MNSNYHTFICFSNAIKESDRFMCTSQLYKRGDVKERKKDSTIPHGVCIEGNFAYRAAPDERKAADHGTNLS